MPKGEGQIQGALLSSLGLMALPPLRNTSQIAFRDHGGMMGAGQMPTLA